ncbi:MAG: DNA polymerase III subunit chi [Rhodospirillaceae bacterium]|nr:DNA polymerase III subunit chi [Rhodospirillaceae bacterium]
MTEIRFYHLQRTTLEAALPQMLEKTLARGQRAVVMAGSPERVEALAESLWTYDERSFLPHGSARDGRPERQPVWITALDENPNGAEVLFLSDGARCARPEDYALCAELFDGNDEAAVTAARRRWVDYKAAGFGLVYFQQDERGRWIEKAREPAGR